MDIDPPAKDSTAPVAESERPPSAKPGTCGKHVLNEIISILADTANGCVGEVGYYPGIPQRFEAAVNENKELRDENANLRQELETLKARCHNLQVVLSQPEHQKEKLIMLLTQDMNRVMTDNSIMQANCLRLQAAQDVAVEVYQRGLSKDEAALREDLVVTQAKYTAAKQQHEALQELYLRLQQETGRHPSPPNHPPIHHQQMISGHTRSGVQQPVPSAMGRTASNPIVVPSPDPHVGNVVSHRSSDPHPANAPAPVSLQYGPNLYPAMPSQSAPVDRRGPSHGLPSHGVPPHVVSQNGSRPVPPRINTQIPMMHHTAQSSGSGPIVSGGQPMFSAAPQSAARRSSYPPHLPPAAGQNPPQQFYEQPPVQGQQPPPPYRHQPPAPYPQQPRQQAPQYTQSFQQLLQHFSQPQLQSYPPQQPGRQPPPVPHQHSHQPLQTFPQQQQAHGVRGSPQIPAQSSFTPSIAHHVPSPVAPSQPFFRQQGPLQSMSAMADLGFQPAPAHTIARERMQPAQPSRPASAPTMVQQQHVQRTEAPQLYTAPQQRPSSTERPPSVQQISPAPTPVSYTQIMLQRLQMSSRPHPQMLQANAAGALDNLPHPRRAVVDVTSEGDGAVQDEQRSSGGSTIAHAQPSPPFRRPSLNSPATHSILSQDVTMASTTSSPVLAPTSNFQRIQSSSQPSSLRPSPAPPSLSNGPQSSSKRATPDAPFPQWPPSSIHAGATSSALLHDSARSSIDVSAETADRAAGYSELEGLLEAFQPSVPATQDATANSSKKRDASQVEETAEENDARAKRARTDESLITQVTAVTDMPMRGDEDEEEVYELGPDGLVPLEVCVGLIMNDDESGEDIKVCSICHFAQEQGMSIDTKPFLRASLEELAAHCMSEHADTFDELRRGVDMKTKPYSQPNTLTS